jgi:hypothetical protein
MAIEYGSELGWRMSRTARRVSEPASETAMGQPSGTIAAPPALAVMTPFSVSKHCEPLTTYQASGPRMTMPWTADGLVCAPVPRLPVG